MRLFIGTSVDGAVATRIQRLAKDQLADRKWRQVRLEQWHVTALFIGEKDPSYLTELQHLIGRIAQATPAIMLRNGTLCSMPPIAPRMLWVKFDPHPALTGLHLSLAGAIGIPAAEHKRYIPHITLARTKAKTDPINGPVLVDELLLDHITLFHSELHPGGSIHRVIGNWPLSRKDPTGPAAVA